MSKDHRPFPPLAEIEEHLSYDPTTGLFTRLKKSGRCAAGSITGSATVWGYVHISYKGLLWRAHRLAWYMYTGEDPGSEEVDHADRIRDHNWIDNLRIATRYEQMMNIGATSRSKTGIRGVVMRYPGLWYASIVVDKKLRQLGSFRTLEAAVTARRDAEVKYFGQFARIDGLSGQPEYTYRSAVMREKAPA